MSTVKTIPGSLPVIVMRLGSAFDEFTHNAVFNRETFGKSGREKAAPQFAP